MGVAEIMAQDAPAIGWSGTTGGIDRAFSRDEILTWVTAYWLTNTIGTSFSPYVEPAKPADASKRRPS
jgi:hypothetical protein